MKKIIFFIFIAIVFWLAPAALAHAATLALSPASATHAVGETFSVSVLVSSSTAINAVSGKVVYPTNMLSVVSVSNSGIVNFWTITPTDAGGSVPFEGVVLSPGFTGSGGKITTITFRAKTTGTATVSFTGTSVLANDGVGTNVLSGSNSASYRIGAASAVSPAPAPAPKIVSATTVPDAPVITSPTHPEPWYDSRAVTLSWPMAADITDVTYLIDQMPLTVPKPRSRGAVTSLTDTVSADGIWYAHVRLKNRAGWGLTGHFKLQIDTAKPTSVLATEGTPDVDGKAVYALSAIDGLSGIARFSVSIDNSPPTLLDATDGQATYDPGILPSGDHLMTVNGYDRAGNMFSLPQMIHIEEIAVPIVSSVKSALTSGDFMILRGTADPDIAVAFTIKHLVSKTENIFSADRGAYVTDATFTTAARTDSAGAFTYVTDAGVPYGVYEITARAKNGSGRMSAESKPLRVTVSEGVFAHAWHFAKDNLLLLISVIGAVFGALFIRMFLRFHHLEMEMRRRKR